MRKRRIKNPRSTVLFLGGLAGISFETFYSLNYHQTPDSGLLVLFGAMLGLPVFLTQDTKDKKNGVGIKPPPADDSEASTKEPSGEPPR